MSRTQPAASALVECLADVDALARLIPWPSSWCSPAALDLLASAGHLRPAGDVGALVEIPASAGPLPLLDVPGTGQPRPLRPAGHHLHPAGHVGEPVECLAVVSALARLIPWPSSWCSPVALDLLASAGHPHPAGHVGALPTPAQVLRCHEKPAVCLLSTRQKTRADGSPSCAFVC